jgi:hypothetical protein
MIVTRGTPSAAERRHKVLDLCRRSAAPNHYISLIPALTRWATHLSPLRG